MTEGEFKTIPDYVNPENRKKILELARPGEKEVSDVECSEYLIRHWNETVEDGNPLYNDPEYARSRGFRDIIAQPGMVICTLVMPYRWPMREVHKTRQLLHFEVKDLLELPVGILANYETFFHLPIEIGDRLSSTGRLVGISPFKRTRLGGGYFTKLETSYYNQRDELVSQAFTNLFSYGGAADEQGEDDAAKQAENENKHQAALHRSSPSRVPLPRAGDRSNGAGRTATPSDVLTHGPHGWER